MSFKPKSCKVCKEKFTPERQFQNTCSFECALIHGKKTLKQSTLNTAKAARKRLKEYNDEDIKILKERATTAFNAFIRKRDEQEPCISCGHVNNGDRGTRQFHAGHYKPAGGYSYIRYDEANVHKQCSICNNHLSGNLVEYRLNLLSKIGVDEVLRLEKPNEIKKWSKGELKDIITKYRQKLRES